LGTAVGILGTATQLIRIASLWCRGERPAEVASYLGKIDIGREMLCDKLSDDVDIFWRSQSN